MHLTVKPPTNGTNRTKTVLIFLTGENPVFIESTHNSFTQAGDTSLPRRCLSWA